VPCGGGGAHPAGLARNRWPAGAAGFIFAVGRRAARGDGARALLFARAPPLPRAAPPVPALTPPAFPRTPLSLSLRHINFFQRIDLKAKGRRRPCLCPHTRLRAQDLRAGVSGRSGHGLGRLRPRPSPAGQWAMPPNHWNIQSRSKSLPRPAGWEVARRDGGKWASSASESRARGPIIGAPPNRPFAAEPRSQTPTLDGTPSPKLRVNSNAALRLGRWSSLSEGLVQANCSRACSAHELESLMGGQPLVCNTQLESHSESPKGENNL
jgi:hypothetical protein